MLKESQLDMFNTKLFPEFYQAERIRQLEEQQDKLRKGLFRRWNDQEKKIKDIQQNLDNLLSLLETETKYEPHRQAIYTSQKVA